MKIQQQACMVGSFTLFLFSRASAADPNFASGVRLGDWNGAGIVESSGIAQSSTGKDIFWTHGDNGENWLACARKDGTYLGRLNINFPAGGDTEDIATGPGPVAGDNYIYYGNIGDNDGVKSGGIYVYRMLEPAINGSFGSLTVDCDTLHFGYPDGPRDCETLMVDPWTKDIYFVSKRDNPVRLYVARYSQPINTKTTLEKLGNLPASIGNWITGGDISADGSEIVLRNDKKATNSLYNRVFYWHRNPREGVYQAMSREPYQIVLNLHQPQGEAICWAKDGSGIYTSSEGTMRLDWYQRLSPHPPLTLQTPARFQDHNADLHAAELPKPQAQPNILFIFSDDHAQHAISAYGSKVNQTPNIDRLAREGVRFKNSFVANSICTPSRATLLTGQYSHLNGVPVFNRFDGTRDNVAKHLQAGGYYTGMIGKWHLGSDPTGFDRWIVLPGQGAYWNPVFLVAGRKLTIAGHCTDITTELGLEFLKTRPQGKPFFLMLHQKAPHRSWEPDERNQALFKDKVIPEPDTLWDDYATRPAALPANEQTVAKDLTRRDLKLEPPADLKGPALNQWLNVKPMELTVDGKTLTGKELVKWKYQRYMRDYLACVQGVDDGVGKVLDYLDQTGLAKNTIVIYSADNGWYLGDLGLYDKRFMYEPGLNVPLLVRGPGIKAGIVPAQFVANIDLAPTFLGLAGLPIPASMQGRSLVPLLRGESPADWRTSFYYRYYHDPGHHNTAAHLGVRTATHKLIFYWKKNAYELFDLTKDPTEQHNLLYAEAEARQPAVAAKFVALKAEIARLQKEYQDDDRYADASTWPKTSADGPFDAYESMGTQTISEAITAAAVR